MGNALVMFVLPEENLGRTSLFKYNEAGEVVPLDDARGFGSLETLRRESPKAFYVMHVPVSAVWEPEREPFVGWHKKPGAVRRQTMLNRRSLETFVNARLAQLDGMVRSGWWSCTE